jgi:hypothetical protein
MPKWTPKSTKNLSKIFPKTEAKLELILASIFDRFCTVLGPKMVPNWCHYFGGGASWGAFGAPRRQLPSKMTPQPLKIPVQDGSKRSGELVPGA